jgi:hypothetical protein
MTKFHLPRKIKKSLQGKLWLYPADEKGNSLMAFPCRSREDYNALKKGIVRNAMESRNSKAKRKAFREKIDKEIFVSDEELKRYVKDIFRENLRNSSYNTFIAAKNNTRAIIAYYNFINAYQLYEKGEESYGNICCLALDLAKDLMKKKK